MAFRQQSRRARRTKDGDKSGGKKRKEEMGNWSNGESD
jgi:hypothetical protein